MQDVIQILKVMKLMGGLGEGRVYKHLSSRSCRPSAVRIFLFPHVTATTTLGMLGTSLNTEGSVRGVFHWFWRSS